MNITGITACRQMVRTGTGHCLHDAVFNKSTLVQPAPSDPKDITSNKVVNDKNYYNLVNTSKSMILCSMNAPHRLPSLGTD